MQQDKLMGKDWLDAQRVEYEMVHVSSMDPHVIARELSIKPAQLVKCELYMGKKEPVLAVHEFTTNVNMDALALHVGDSGFRPATNDEIRTHTHQDVHAIHPFIEGYLWKVLDEKLFEHEKIYLFTGEKNTLLCIDSTALKYSVGVINGLIANIT